jgi:hypothetical protein
VKKSIRLALGIEVRHVVGAHQDRHALAVGRQEAAGVLERRPNDVRDARALGRLGHRIGLLQLSLG